MESREIERGLMFSFAKEHPSPKGLFTDSAGRIKYKTCPYDGTEMSVSCFNNVALLYDGTEMNVSCLKNVTLLYDGTEMSV
jgi:hypothetical protein